MTLTAAVRMTYLQNRYNSPLSDPPGSCPYCVYTDIGLASTPDQGTTWIYRGVAQGVDLPAQYRNFSLPSTRPPASQSQMYGGATWWRPAVVRQGGKYHGYFVYNPAPGGEMADLKIVHYTSSDLKNWEFVELARDRPVGTPPLPAPLLPSNCQCPGASWLSAACAGLSAQRTIASSSRSALARAAAGCSSPRCRAARWPTGRPCRARAKISTTGRTATLLRS